MGGAENSDSLRFAVQIADVSDRLAKLHREASEKECINLSSVESKNQGLCESSSSAAAAQRKQTILWLTERLAYAAETLADAHAIQAHTAQTEREVASVEDLSVKQNGASLVRAAASLVRRSADRQARHVAIPLAEHIDSLPPEWVQHQMRWQMSAPSKVLGNDEVSPLRLKSRGHRLSLKCPLSGNIFSVPVRGAYCEHLACFDLESMRQAAPATWRCPIIGCAAYVTPCELRRDSFIEALCRLTRSSLSAINLAPEFANIACTGSVLERANTLAEKALNLHAAVVPSPVKPFLAIEIHDSESDTEADSPHAKRRCLASDLDDVPDT